LNYDLDAHHMDTSDSYCDECGASLDDDEPLCSEDTKMCGMCNMIHQSLD